jgi:hypothetical protein
MDWSDVDFQDAMWSFFQNCWHLKDWIKNDPRLLPSTKDALHVQIHSSPVLMVVRDLANGAKHLKLNDPNIAAQHHHVNTTIIPGVVTRMDLFVEMADGSLRSGEQVAKECMAEWDAILKAAGLPV